LEQFKHKGSVAELSSERNFQLASEKKEERGGILKLSMSTSDEFFAAGRWKSQLKIIRQQTLKAHGEKIDHNNLFGFIPDFGFFFAGRPRYFWFFVREHRRCFAKGIGLDRTADSG
jgi:hypothetical protein